MIEVSTTSPKTGVAYDNRGYHPAASAYDRRHDCAQAQRARPPEPPATTVTTASGWAFMISSSALLAPEGPRGATFFRRLLSHLESGKPIVDVGPPSPEIEGAANGAARLVRRSNPARLTQANG